MFTQLLKERDSIAAQPVFPQSINGASGTTGAVDMSLFARCQFLGFVGSLGGSATVDCRLMETNEAGGGNATNIANASITQISTANRAFTIEVQAMQMTKRYLVGVITVGVAASVVGLFPIATEGRYPPVTNNDNNTVAQRVAVPLS